MLLYIKKAVSLALAAAMTLSLAACSGGSGEEDEVVQGETIGEEIADIAAADDIFSLNSDQSGTFNPYTDTSVYNHMFMTLVYDNIFDLDAEFNLSSRIIRDYSCSEDATSWSFYVDNTVTFQDGTPVTAYDVAYSLLRAARGTEYGARLKNLVGVSALDDELFMVSLYEPNRMFPMLLNVPVIKDGASGDTAPAGTGPYRFSDDHTRLELWEGHPQAADMPIDVIYLKEYDSPEDIISAFEDSLIDLVQNDPTGMSDLGYGSANEKRYCTTTNMHYIGFNQNSAFFCYPHFRAAVTYMIDREHIVTELMGGAGVEATLPISPLSPLYNETFASYFGYDMTNAALALQNAGASDQDADGLLEFLMGAVKVDIDINFIVCGDSAVKVQAARDIADKMRELGLEVTLRELNWNDYQTALQEGDYDMYYAEVKLSADFNISELVTEDGSLNYGEILDPGYDTYIGDYLAATDTDRQMYCELMCQYFTQTAPIVPICFEKTEMLTHRGVVSGASPTQYDLFHDFASWTIEIERGDAAQ